MFWNGYRSIVLTAFGSAFLASIATTAIADIIQIPAITFTSRSSSTTIGDANAGTLTNAVGKFYAAVPFTTNGQRVCRFTLVHRDNDDSFRIIARLLKKNILVGSNAFEAPTEMASAFTTAGGTTQFVAKRSVTTIVEPVINLNSAFYYVELEITGALVETLGVQIDVRPSCTG